jgi:hypothetical protein
MNYEEYEARMNAQKRKPVEREHYEEVVEKAYMALGDVDKDEFCALSDKVVGAVRRLADALDKERKVRRGAEEGAARIAEKQKELAMAVDAQRNLIDELNARCENLCSQIRARNELLEYLVAEMKPSNIVMALLNR